MCYFAVNEYVTIKLLNTFYGYLPVSSFSFKFNLYKIKQFIMFDKKIKEMVPIEVVYGNCNRLKS